MYGNKQTTEFPKIEFGSIFMHHLNIPVYFYESDFNSFVS